MAKKMVILIFLLLLFYREHIPENHARVLLAPYARVTELFYNNRHVYIEGTGYVETGGGYIIGRDCLGIGFTALLFVFCAFYPLKSLNGAKEFLWVALSALLSAFSGFIVNSIRILNSLTYLTHEKFHTLHAASGTALYLLALYTAYFLLAKAFGRKTAGGEIM